MAACGSALQGTNGSSSTNASANQLKISTLAGAASVGSAYNAVTSVSGGVAPYSFSVSAGVLPPGTSLNPTTGSIAGIPYAVGTYNFVLSASASMARQSDGSVFTSVSGRLSNPVSPSSMYGSTTVQIVVSRSSGPSIIISPNSATVTSQAQQQFTAHMTGTADTAVKWSASVGSISSSGAFVAPTVSSNTPAVITATSATNPSLRAVAGVTIVPRVPLAIADSTLPQAQTGTPYMATLSATGGVAPYQWSVSSGTLPSGIDLQAASGAITGMTALSGSYPFSAKVTDASSQTASLPFTLTVSSGSASGFDGPAELPRIYIQTAMASTPAPGSVTTVNAGGDFQSALDNANCGDTIQLQAGATFSGAFNFPAKSCDDNHWIIIRTSAPDSSLPAEGTRLTPCYAGVTSLPGRPAFNCASTKNVLARLLMPTGGSRGPVVFLPGANHYRLIGLEITRAAGTGVVYALASIAATNGTGNNFILDRVWLHGTAQDETKKGFELGGMSYASAIDSFFTNMQCIDITGTCTDAAAIGGGSGDPVGPFKIVDNFLESSGENILLGGAAATTTPADIQISQNHFFKPLIWMPGQPGFVGGTNGEPFVVKNLFELKNAQRVLLEANIMEYSWGGFSQKGYGIVLTPTNQSGTCPACQVTDVTIRYNTVSHVGAGIQIANVLSGDPASFDGQRYSIHDITIDDINSVKYSGSGRIVEIMGQTGAPLLQNFSINHITAFSADSLFSVGGPITPKMVNFNFTNSIALVGSMPIDSTGGAVNCANIYNPLPILNACFAPYSFARNALIATPSTYPPSMWPSGNFFPAAVSAVQFVNYNNGNGGNYQLLSTSPYHNAGTDGKDLGADIAAILSETTGVY